MQSKATSILRGTAIVSGLTGLSRILGFVREILIARLFGASFIADAFLVAFRIPNLLRSIFAEGALTSAFVPVLSNDLHINQETAKRTFSNVLGLLLIASTITSLLGIIFTEEIVHFIAPGFRETDQRFLLSVTLARIMMPYIIFVSAVALINGALNTLRIFGVSAWAQIVMNLVLIITAFVALGFEQTDAAWILAWSVVFGGVAQVVAQLRSLNRSGFSLKPTFDFASDSVKKIFQLFIPAVIGATVYQISMFIMTQFASILEVGSVAWLSYADRIAQLPIGVFAIALSSVLLPSLSSSFSKSNESEFSKILTDGLRWSLFVMLPSSVFLFIFANEIVHSLFVGGKFTSNDAYASAMAVRGYTLGLCAISLQSLLARAFHASQDTKTPLYAALVALVIQIIVASMLIGIPISGLDSAAAFLVINIRELSPDLMKWNLGHYGIAIASSIGFTISTLLLFVKIKSRLIKDDRRRLLETLANNFLATAAFLSTAIYLKTQFEAGLTGYFMNVLISTLIWLLALKLLKASELTEILNRVRTRLKS